MEGERIVISKWNRQPKDKLGKKLQLEQVVYKQAIGKNKKGEPIYRSITRHEQVN